MSDKSVVILALSFALMPVSASAFWPFDSDQELFAQACEAVLQERLVSPTSYKRVDIADISRSDGNLNDYFELTSPKRLNERAAMIAADPAYAEAVNEGKRLYEARKPERVSIIIKYDASNKMGVDLRGIAECSDYIERGTDWSDNDYHNLRIDGLSALSWSLDKLSD